MKTKVTNFNKPVVYTVVLLFSTLTTCHYNICLPAHNLKVVGSNPTPAPNLDTSKARSERKFRAGFVFLGQIFGAVSHG